MTDATRRHVLTAIGASAVAAGCTPLPRVASTESEEPRGGIGGTGIVGTLTGFGSLLVNGQRIVIADNAAILSPLGPLTEADLAIGQALSIEANRIDGQLRAQRILIADPLTGAIDAIDADQRGFSVLGVHVQMDPSLSVTPVMGQRVAVSGLWRDRQVVATRIAPAPDGLDAVAGVVGSLTDQTVAIGGVSMALPEGVAPGSIGEFAIARGRHDGATFLARSVTAGRFTGAAGPLESLSVEGYLSPITTAPGYQVDGLGHSFAPTANLAALAENRSLFEGPYTGLFDVSTALRLPENANDRATLLAQSQNGTLPLSAKLSTRS